MSAAPTPSAAPAIGVLGLGLWLPGFPSAAAWSSGAADPEALKPQGLALDRVNRRRAGMLGRAIADASAQAIEQSGVDAATIATVVGSAIGEAAAMISLLEQMWRTKEPLSPAAFTVSVHNASSGLLSISCKNRGYANSLAADENTPAMALLEALGLVQTGGGPVLVACGDEGAPESLVRDEPTWELLGAAVVLGPADSDGVLARLRVLAEGEPSLPPADVSEGLARNPQVGLVDVVSAVLRGEAGRVRLDRGRGRGYLAEVEPLR